MKRATLLVASIFVNVISLGLLAWVALHGPDPLPAARDSSSDLSRPLSQSLNSPTSTFAASPARTGSGPEWQNWLDSLRAAGVPEKVMAGLVSSDFEGRWQARQREMERQFRLGEVDSDVIMRFNQQHDLEQEKEMRAAIGDEGFRRWDKERLMVEFDLAKMKVAPAETDALYDLRRDLDRKWRELDLTRQNGQIDDADFEEKTEAGRVEYEAKLKSLLGEERYAAMQSNSEDNMGDLRRNLKSVNATSDQTDAMSQAQRQWNEARAKLDRDNQEGKFSGNEYEVQMRAMDAARDAQFQQVLGTNGFADLQRAQDNRYKMMKRYASAWQLSDSDINSLYNTLQYYQNNVRDYQQRAKAVEAEGQPVDWPAVQTALKEFNRQTEEAIQKSLGEERFRKMKRNSVFQSDEDLQAQ